MVTITNQAQIAKAIKRPKMSIYAMVTGPDDVFPVLITKRAALDLIESASDGQLEADVENYSMFIQGRQ